MCAGASQRLAAVSGVHTCTQRSCFSHIPGIPKQKSSIKAYEYRLRTAVMCGHTTAQRELRTSRRGRWLAREQERDQESITTEGACTQLQLPIRQGQEVTTQRQLQRKDRDSPAGGQRWDHSSAPDPHLRVSWTSSYHCGMQTLEEDACRDLVKGITDMLTDGDDDFGSSSPSAGVCVYICISMYVSVLV